MEKRYNWLKNKKSITKISKKFRKFKIHSILFFLLLFIVNWNIFSDVTNEISNSKEGQFLTPFSINSELNVASYRVMSPFVIDEVGNGNYTWAEAVLEDWCNGSGTEEDPFIIDRIFIDAENKSSTIEIWNSDKYFVLRNSVFTNSGRYLLGSIVFQNVNNGKIENCISSNNRNSFYLWGCSNNQILNNVITNNSFGGIVLQGCTNNLIMFNNISNNNGISMTASSDNLVYGNRLITCKISLSQNSQRNNISNNYVENNDFSGIGVSTCEDNQIFGNLLVYNEVGIYISQSTNNSIFDNVITNYKPADQGHYYRGMMLDNSHYNTIEKNEITFEYWGITLTNCHYNYINSNNISHNRDNGIYLASSNYNTITQNYLINNSINIDEDSHCVGNVISGNIYTINPNSSEDIYFLILLIGIISIVALTISLITVRRVVKKKTERKYKIAKVKRVILDLSTKITRLQLVDIIERTNIENQDLIKQTVLDMLENREVFGDFFTSSNSLVFDQNANIKEIDILLDKFKEWEEKEIQKKS